MDRAAQIQTSLAGLSASLEGAVSQYGQGMDAWDEKDSQHLEEAERSREQLKTKLNADWAAANERSTCIQDAARSVCAELTRAVDEQMGDVGVQMEALDGFVTRAKCENATLHEAHAQSVHVRSGAVEQSLGNILGQVATTCDQVKTLGEELEADTNDLCKVIEPLEAQLCQPLASLREGISNTALQEYQPTGATPQKAVYRYPTELPRTEVPTAGGSEDGNEDEGENDDTLAFPGPEDAGTASSSPCQPDASARKKGRLGRTLREADPNVAMNAVTGVVPSTASMAAEHTIALLKRSARPSRGTRKLGVAADARENLPPTAFSRGMSRRKSQRLE